MTASPHSSTPPRPATPDWHASPHEAVLNTLQADTEGLSHTEAARRLAQHGPNRLNETPPPGALLRLARQFNNLLLQILIGAALITALLGHWVDAVVIGAVVMLNAIIGFVQEGKAERALQAIRHLLAPHAVVLREGVPQDIAAADLVPGDIVLLASGDSLPADVRLLHARNLRVDEAALTGESVPVDKHVEPVEADASIGDRFCMGYAGTLVTQGQARAVVVATGNTTEMGRIGRLLSEVGEGTTPLIRSMGVFSQRLTFVILGLAALLFGFGTWVRGLPAAEMFMAAVGLAVSAIPEGLPAILTITLAIGVQRMARRHAVIRRLPAVETLGAVTTICSDKTGTLTRNEMTVQAVLCAGQTLGVEGVGYAPQGELRLEGDSLAPDELARRCPAAYALARAGALCNDASLQTSGAEGQWQLAGDPTEGALLTLALKASLEPAALREAQPRLDVIPFESDHRYMATLHAHAAGCEVLVKGAPERVLLMCAWQLGPDGQPISLETAHWQAAIEAQARAGRRVLALARRRLDAPLGRALQHADVQGGLELLGLVGIIDPPREEAIQAVAQCHAAGIRVVMITGDHAVTAAAIATQLGILQPHSGYESKGASNGSTSNSHRQDATVAVTGAQVEALDDAQLRELVRSARVFARASPEHKLRLVRAMQANGEIVAMTGDGVNDAPALKQADVGVAMGRKGTEAAKQAGAVVLGDDNFASIAHAVEEGRTVYDNLKKTITFLLPINGGESLTLLVAVLLGVAMPILPAQVLWVNMVSSVALALVLAFEPMEAGVMRRPPRAPSEPLLSRFLVWRIGFVSALFLAGIFGMYAWALHHGLGMEAARTAAVNTLVAMEVFYLFSVRYLKSPSFTWEGVRGTPRVLASVAVVFVLQLLFTYTAPMQALFHSAALPLWLGGQIVAVGVLVLVTLEVEKTILRRLGALA